ncbi:hypothetical protein [Nocardioides sp. AE5]|uniref:hypothetical protein n=1 Tax=Nocardioides sp. AE5 TaxID=2962573 RepID=UPI0028825A78|nr:hypothetical protein [Nocardioides sp. AE5]MDT0201634.1 hypothetical protein [Nocardioides sp. AE5]
METSVTLGLRYIRAAVLAFVVLATGAIAHATAGGLLPSVTMMVFLFGAATVGLAMFLGRPATAARIVALTVVGQTLAHLAFSLSAGHVGDPVAAAAPRPAPTPIDPGAGGSFADQFAAGGPHVDASLAIPAEVVHLFTELATPAHAWMTLLHVAAAVAVGLWLAVGERAIWTLVALAATVLVPVLGLAMHAMRTPARFPHATRVTHAPRHLATLARSVVRRGPPALLPA